MDHQQRHGIQNNNPLFLGFNHAVHLHCPYPRHPETRRNSDPSPPQGNSPLQVVPHHIPHPALIPSLVHPP
uniref:Uncharacterized protein n=1 Tax=Gossypium raimondii TaxID=29730 RepID=A0A0D2PB34_GOSRA|nr:hypothetical protein B456_004G127100 [Gossypium raimondii]